jgi:hypothetical protein
LGDFSPESFDGALCGFSQERLELGESVLDRIEVGTVGREIEQLGAGRLDSSAYACAPVRSEVVHDDDVAGLELWNEDLIDIGLERRGR